MIKQVIATAGLVLFAGAVTAGEPSSFAESKGFQRCVNVVEREARSVRVEPTYYYTQTANGSRLYYLNGVGLLEGGASELRVACETTSSGHRVLNVSVDPGRYVGRVVEATKIAAN